MDHDYRSLRRSEESTDYGRVPQMSLNIKLAVVSLLVPPKKATSAKQQNFSPCRVYGNP